MTKNLNGIAQGAGGALLGLQALLLEERQNSLRGPQSTLRSGIAREKFPVGTIIPDTWTDIKTGRTYDMPLRVVDYRMITLAGGEKCKGAVLLRVNAGPRLERFGGDNCYATSDIHPWLQNDYARGCSEELLQVVAPIILNDVDIREARFFLPRPEELHVDPYENPDLENLVWEFFADTPTNWFAPCAKRVFPDSSGTAQACWLRSAYRGSAYRVWIADTDGSAYLYIAYLAYACAPACIII